jgi:hypothetical protein
MASTQSALRVQPTYSATSQPRRKAMRIEFLQRKIEATHLESRLLQPRAWLSKGEAAAPDRRN